MDTKRILDEAKKKKLLKENPLAQGVADIVAPEISKLREEIETIKNPNDLATLFFKMFKGDKGDTPEKYEDYFTEEDIQEIVERIEQLIPPMIPDPIKGDPGQDGYTPIKGKDYFDGKDGEDGKDAEVDYKKIVEETLKKIPKAKDGHTPNHKIEGLRLAFENPDGTWGNWIDLSVFERVLKSRQISGGGVGTIKDAGTVVKTGASEINFGDNLTVTVTEHGVKVDAAAGGAGGHTIQEEGSDLTARTYLDFIGAGITASDDAGNDKTKITLDATLNSLAALGTASDKIAYTTGVDTWAEADITVAGRALLDDATAGDQRTTLGLGTVATLASDTDGTLAANSDVRIATQKAVKTYVDGIVTGLLDFKGSTDASGNPNYPVGLKGDFYIVTVAGKIGGASGKSVDVGDAYFATADNAGGTEAAVGTSWSVLEHNLQGALLSANNLSDVADAATARGNLGAAASATTITINGTANEVSSSAGAQDLSANRTWTISLPSTIDLGGKTSLEIPNSAAPTVDADGEIAVDTTVTDFSHGILKYFSGEELGVVAMPIAQFTTPSNGYLVAYNSTNDEFELVAPGAGSGDVTAASNITDNRIVRGDGGLKGIQESLVSIDDSGNITGVVALTTSGLITSSLAGVGLRVVNTTDNASVQVAKFEGDRATMADNDEAYISYLLSDDGGTQTEIARMTWVATDVNAATSVDGLLTFSVMTTGSLSTELSLSGGALYPSSNDGLALGIANTNMWSDLYMASGSVFNWNNGDVTLTHAANALTLSGGRLWLDSTAGFIQGHSTQLTIGGVTTEHEVVGASEARANISIGLFNATGTNAPKLSFYRSKNASVGSATVVASGDQLGSITWYGAQQTGTFATQNPAAQIRAEVGGTVTSGAGADMPGKLIFATTPDASGTLTDRLILDAAGVLKPNANDGVALGTTSLGFADLHLASGGNITAGGVNAKKTLVLSAAGAWSSTTQGAATVTKVEYVTNDVDLQLIDFDDTTEERVQWTVIMPDSYDGSTLTAVFYWTSNAGSAGETVRWGIQGRSYGDDEAIDQAWGTAQEVSDDWIADGDVHITAATSAITLAGTPAGGELVQFRVYRDTGDAADDHTGDARLIAVKLEYGINAYSD